MKQVLAVIWLIFFLNGCATVKTTVPASGTISAGVAYYLPRRDIKIAAERSVLKLEDAKKKVAAAVKTEGEADTAAKAAAAELKAQEALLPLLASGTDAWKEAEALRATFAAKKTLTAAALSEAKAAVALARADQATIEASPGGQCLYRYDAKIELLPAVPDHKMRFTAQFAHNVLRDDDWKLSVSADGLLTSSNVIAADRTGDIIVELAGAIAGFGTSGLSVLKVAEDNKSVVNCDAPAVKFVYQFDPVDSPESDSSINGKLVNAGFPLKLTLKGNVQEGPSCHTPPAEESPAAAVLRLSNGQCEVIGQEGKAGALFYRSAVPVTVIIEQCSIEAAGTIDCNNSRPVDAALVLIPQLGPISYIPMRSSAFVRTVNDVTFSNGSITSWNATRPSEALEVVRLPVRVLTSIISVPAQILSLRVNVSDKDKALAVSQQGQIAARLKLEGLKSCIEKATRDGSNPDICLVD